MNFCRVDRGEKIKGEEEESEEIERIGRGGKGDWVGKIEW